MHDHPEVCTLDQQMPMGPAVQGKNPTPHRSEFLIFKDGESRRDPCPLENGKRTGESRDMDTKNGTLGGPIPCRLIVVSDYLHQEKVIWRVLQLLFCNDGVFSAQTSAYQEKNTKMKLR